MKLRALLLVSLLAAPAAFAQTAVFWRQLSQIPSPTVTAAGDATGTVTLSPTTGATLTLTLANSGVTAATYGSATQSLTATVDAKGRITSLAAQTITPSVASITGLGTGVATWLATPSIANLIAATPQVARTDQAQTFAGVQTLSGYLLFSANEAAGASGTIFRHSANGMQIRGHGGSTADFTLSQSNGTPVVWNAVGTNNVAVAGHIGIGAASASNAALHMQGSVSASGGYASAALNQTAVTAAANSDVLRSLSVEATAAKGAFTGLTYTGIHVANPAVSGAGTITNHYGIYIDTPNRGTNNYALFAAGNLAADKFGSNVGTDIASHYLSFGSGTANLSTGGNINFQLSGTTSSRFVATTGEWLIATTTDGGDYKLQVNGAALTSSLTTGAPAGGTAAAWKMGTVDSVALTSPNRSIEVEVGGTTYYLSAKTTKD